MNYVPDQGDIVLLDFDPGVGKEIMKRRPAFVISRKLFNGHTGFAIVAPVTSTVRGISLEVELPKKLGTKGSVLVYQMKSVDHGFRKAKFVEKAPSAILEKVLEITRIITQ